MPERYKLHDLLSHDERGHSLIREVIGRLNEGEVCIYPTETIYGIGGKRTTPGVYDKVVLAKRRPPENPFLLIAGSWNSFQDLQLDMPVQARRLADTFWPGNLTLVLWSNSLHEWTGVRVSNHPLLKLFDKHRTCPLISTSANIHGEPYINDPHHIWNVMDSSVDFFIDAGILPESRPSSIVRVRQNGSAEILREGPLGWQRLKEVAASEGDNDS